MIDLEVNDLIESFPKLNPEAVRGGIVYYCPSDDAVSFDRQTWVPLEKFYCAVAVPKYKEGDKVYHNKCEALVSKVIEEFSTPDYTFPIGYEIIFADPSLDRLIVPEDSLRTLLTDYLGNEIKCECGVDSVNGGRHSDYCPKATKNRGRL